MRAPERAARPGQAQPAARIIGWPSVERLRAARAGGGAAAARRPWRPWQRRRARLPLPPRVWAGYLGWLKEQQPWRPPRRLLEGWLVGAAATAGLAVGIAATALRAARAGCWRTRSSGLSRAAVQDVRSANGMNDATQPQHCAPVAARLAAPQAAAPPRVWLPCSGAVQQRAAPLLLGPENRGPAPVSAKLAGELQLRAVTPEPASAQL